MALKDYGFQREFIMTTQRNSRKYASSRFVLPGGRAPSPSSLQCLGKWRRSGPALQGQRGGSLVLCLRCTEAVKCGVKAGSQEPAIPASRSSRSLLVSGGPSQWPDLSQPRFLLSLVRWSSLFESQKISVWTPKYLWDDHSSSPFPHDCFFHVAFTSLSITACPTTSWS